MTQIATPESDGWAEWRIHILAELKRLGKGQEAMLDRFDSLPCGEHEAQIKAVEKETNKQGINWGKLTNITLAIAQTLIIAWILAQ